MEGNRCKGGDRRPCTPSKGADNKQKVGRASWEGAWTIGDQSRANIRRGTQHSMSSENERRKGKIGSVPIGVEVEAKRYTVVRVKVKGEGEPTILGEQMVETWDKRKKRCDDLKDGNGKIRGSIGRGTQSLGGEGRSKLLNARPRGEGYGQV